MSRKQRLAGDFNDVYESTYPLLFRVAYRITGSASVTEDLCQEAFIRYLKRSSPLPSIDEARYWLIRVVKNLSLNHEKRKSRERRAYERLGREPKRIVPSGEVEAMQGESIQLVQKALNRLPFKLRSAIVLREYGDLSYREIASVLGISEANVKVRVFRAREQLKRLLDEGEVYVS